MKFLNSIFIINIFIFQIISQNINEKEISKIIYFDLDKKDDIIIKDIFLQKYNTYFNLALDTLGFISGLFISKSLRYDFILGQKFSPENSFRIFEGNSADINLYENSNNSNFKIVLFKHYKDYYFYDKNKTYDGIMGLALNYTSDIVLDECYFFREDKKYSIMNYLIKELKLIDKNIFYIYKNKYIIGDIIKDISNFNITYCKTQDKIEESFIYFFWNCDIDSINFGKKYKNKTDIKISLLIDSLLKKYMISTNKNVANIIINEINSGFNNHYLNLNICDIYQNKIYCLMEYYGKIKDKSLIFRLNDEVEIEIPFDILIINKTKKYFNLNIELNEYNIDKNQNILKVGKFLFDLYLIIFDAENKRIGFKKLENISKKINFDKKYHYTNIFPYKEKNNLDTNRKNIIKSLFFIVILLCFIGIILLLYGKNNYFYYI